MFRNPLLIAGGEFFSLEITSDTLIGDLWTFLGSPSSPTQVSILVDNCDIGDVQISTQFAAGSTFAFTCVNGGRILGLGGDGGGGAFATFPYGGAGTNGTAGGAAITSAYAVNVDVDDGYLFGGGGGGGGGSAIYISFSGGGYSASGGGGGGGQGYTGGDGGLGGTNGYSGGNGVDGTRSGPGAGGTANTPTLQGGAGGKWGSAGTVGGSSGYLLVSGSSFQNVAGVGGNAGPAFLGTGSGAITFDGSKSEATLRAEGRILGETGETGIVYAAQGAVNDDNVDGSPLSSTHGFTFKTDGDLVFLDASGNTTLTTRWIDGTQASIGDDFQVRRTVPWVGSGSSGTWDAEAAAQGTWININLDRTWSFTNVAGSRVTAGYFEIRRVDVPLNPDDEIIANYWLLARDTG